MEILNYFREEWRDIKGYEGLYQASNYGRVRSMDRTCKFIKSRTQIKKGRILKHGVLKNGYCFVILVKKTSKKLLYIHRLVAEAFIPNPKNLPEVNHKDENKANNAASNLEWCSHRHNINCYWNCRNRKKSGKRRILMFDGNHKLGTYYINQNEASADLNISKKTIRDNMYGIHKSRYGYSFEWE